MENQNNLTENQTPQQETPLAETQQETVQTPPQAIPPQMYPPQAYQPQMYPPPMYPPQAYQPQMYQPPMYPPQAYQPQMYQPPMYQPQPTSPQPAPPQEKPSFGKMNMFGYLWDEPILNKKGVIIGLLLIPVYLFILPLALEYLLYYLGEWFNFTLTVELLNIVYFSVMIVIVLSVFGKFLLASLKALKTQMSAKWLYIPILSLIITYGGNFVASMICMIITGSNQSENNQAVTEMVGNTPIVMLLMTVIAAPLVEETFYRAVLFRPLSLKSTMLAYSVSALLFALLHVWQAALSDPAELIYIIMYLPTSIGLAFAHHQLRNIYGSMLVHAIVNAVAVGLLILLDMLNASLPMVSMIF
ncbi:MAG: CPBP family intramembrane metalloprotease [Oscillospiraceae bacterium]|jgi:membrane protease YdiL (CAAX protease family)|nr:CPBP family intramembrane metalloprotease [Oscillospiraceae bacterium]